MARIRLSEFMEYQKRGQTGWTQVAGGDRHDSSTWTVYRPVAGDINSRSAIDESSNFTQYSTLTFGWERDNQEEPWYLPTFNHDSTDLTTAAAGDAQDYLERGATHPGDGKDNFWQANISYTNGQNDIVWPGSTEGTRTTSQNLRQERNPITLQEWRALRTEAENDEVGRNKRIGNFWVMDPETGWAYWANRLNPGQATSYLIDEARMEDAARAIQGSYYYAIHVDSELINVSAERFSHEDQASEALEELLDRIRVGADGNASPQFPAPVRDFTFSTMRDTAGSNRIFTVDSPGEPQEFRYLENMEGGYHWIISNSVLTYTSWYEQEDRMDAWFDEELSPEFRALVAPVAESFSTGDVHDSRVGGTTGGLQISGTLLSITNLSAYPEVAADRTRVVSEAEGGIPRAFALSVADVQYLTFGTTSGFMNNAPDRMAASPWPNLWWLRTPATHPLFPQFNSAWTIAAGVFTAASGFQRSHTISNLGARPALIIHQ